MFIGIKKGVKLHGETPCVLSDLKYDKSTYYVCQKMDRLILSVLMENIFNPACIQGTFELAHIDNHQSDSWAITDGFLAHIPRTLNIDSTNIKIEGKYLLIGSKPQVKFEIDSYDRYYDKLEGEVAYLDLKELEPINGIQYYYSFEMLE